MVCPVKNESRRLHDWILYHAHQGVELFVMFDDHSSDDTKDKIRDIANKYGLEIIIEDQDRIGDVIPDEYAMRPDKYYFNQSMCDRILRCLTKGNQIIKNIDPEYAVALLDIDEFVVTGGKENLRTVVDQTFGERSEDCPSRKQILVNSFDVTPLYEWKDRWTTEDTTKDRWSIEETSNHKVWKTRCKPIIVSKYMDECVFCHVPFEEFKDPSWNIHAHAELIFKARERYSVDPETIRMHHFRKPVLDTLPTVEDRTLIEKSKEAREFFLGDKK